MEKRLLVRSRRRPGGQAVTKTEKAIIKAAYVQAKGCKETELCLKGHCDECDTVRAVFADKRSKRKGEKM